MMFRISSCALVAALLSGCGDEEAAPFRSSEAQVARAAIDGTPDVVTNADGTAAAVFVSSPDLALFDTGSGVLAGLEAWVVANARMLGLDPVIDGAPPMTLVADDVIDDGVVQVHRFVQTFKGYPVAGPGEAISVMVVDGYARMVVGTIADERRTLNGERGAMDERTASAQIEATWLASGGDPVLGVTDLQLVAMPGWGSLVWMGTVQTGEWTPGGTVMVDAVSASQSWLSDDRYYAMTDHDLVGVVAHQMFDDPTTNATILFQDLPASEYGTCSMLPGDLEQCELRMGDDRMAIYDAQEQNNDPFHVWTELRYDEFTHQHNALFDGNLPGTFHFETQDIFQKTSAALEVIDARMAQLKWDHHPDSQFGANHPVPLSFVTNLDTDPEQGEADHCDGHQGWIIATHPTGPSWSQAESLWVDSSEPTAVVAICQMDESVALHELGHYVDHYATYGVIGHGLGSGTCYPGTTDESPAVKETLADLMSLALARKLYPTLDYTASQTDFPCKTGAMGVAASTIHDAACGVPPHSFYDDFTTWLSGPSFDPEDGPCNGNLGYKQGALMQASWEFMNGKECDEVAPYACTDAVGADPDALLRSVTLTLTAGNHWSYFGLFKGIGLVLAYEESYAEGQRWAHILEHHGLPVQ